MKTIRLLARRLARLILTVLLAGALGSMLMVWAPGAEADLSDLDPRLNDSSRQALLAERSRAANLRLYWEGLLLRADLGWSASFQQPVSALIADRMAITLRPAALGLAASWLLALLLAAAVVASRSRLFDFLANLTAGQLLCVPAALVALFLFFLDAPAWIGIAAVVFPRLFRYASDLLHAALSAPHVSLAEAKGLPGWRVLAWHVLPPALPQLIALGGVSSAAALGAAIPVEVLADIPGIGQLAWKAALGRDLPLLAGLTLLNTFLVMSANTAADMVLGTLRSVRS